MPKPQLRPAYARLPCLLKELREDASLTQRELAQRLNIPQNTVYRMEQAIRRCDVFEFIAWCRACDADPVDEFEKLLKAR